MGDLEYNRESTKKPLWIFIWENIDMGVVQYLLVLLSDTKLVHFDPMFVADVSISHIICMLIWNSQELLSQPVADDGF